MKCILNLMMVVLAGGLNGCSTFPSRNASGPDRTIHLTAGLNPPADIELAWTDAVPGAAGHIIEFATDPQGEFVILDFLPPEQTAFKHDDLMPETKFYYRVRAYYGPASSSVEVRLPEDLADTNYAARFATPEDFSWALPETITSGVRVATGPLRGTNAAAAAPADLQFEFKPVTVSGFKLTWTDHASDEDGYLLEMKPDGNPDFQVCALMAPKINSIGFALEPPVRKASFRVRAFYYGKPSNLASATTLAETAAAQTGNSN